MNSPKKKKRTSKYDAKLRIAIAQEYLTTDMGYGSLSKKYGIAVAGGLKQKENSGCSPLI